tara:strand:- start:22 stop:243 length:222 start_codon:yes stop_codon:yes gene_type:complete
VNSKPFIAHLKSLTGVIHLKQLRTIGVQYGLSSGEVEYVLKHRGKQEGIIPLHKFSLDGCPIFTIIRKGVQYD